MAAIQEDKLKIDHILTKILLDSVKEAHRNAYFQGTGIDFRALESRLKQHVENWVLDVESSLRHMQLLGLRGRNSNILPELRNLVGSCQIPRLTNNLDRLEREMRTYEENFIHHAFSWDENKMQPDRFAQQLVELRFTEYSTFDKSKQRMKTDIFKPRIEQINLTITRENNGI
eukprot:CAMPEP_0185279982 /NCGR_PEP_ID=MMETSP1359-20130426/64918_1 /TAXON_ID=552665 /ORGANISM="Bigelowiella longifila, Strain CCMP242" /LENGTH=172 /DNA_ID=CAMNT_0027875045 /DNA_START=200 /DNA_END=715 /DNA_ORIENTATION=+